MPLKFASIVPHPPLLIPSLGKDNLARLKQTNDAYIQLADKLSQAGVDTIIMISPHGPTENKKFIINKSPRLEARLEEFGDHAYRKIYSGNPALAANIQKLQKKQTETIQDENLDYGSSIPLNILLKENSDIKILPIYYSELGFKEHIEFGNKLYGIIKSSNENIALIASGDLSHRINKNSPAPYSPKAKKFDQKIIKYLQDKKTFKIAEFDPKYVEEMSECGLRSILILLGVLNNVNYEPQNLSYEAPFGIGYLVMNLKINY